LLFTVKFCATEVITVDYTFAALNCVSTKMFYFVGNWHEEAFQEIEEEEVCLWFMFYI